MFQEPKDDETEMDETEWSSGAVLFQYCIIIPEVDDDRRSRLKDT